MDTSEPAKPALHSSYDSAELGALAHLYRGEVYRSTIWRTRLDNTTNWSVATLGIIAPMRVAGALCAREPGACFQYFGHGARVRAPVDTWLGARRPRACPRGAC